MSNREQLSGVKRLHSLTTNSSETQNQSLARTASYVSHDDMTLLMAVVKEGCSATTFALAPPSPEQVGIYGTIHMYALYPPANASSKDCCVSNSMLGCKTETEMRFYLVQLLPFSFSFNWCDLFPVSSISNNSVLLQAN